MLRLLVGSASLVGGESFECRGRKGEAPAARGGRFRREGGNRNFYPGRARGQELSFMGCILM